MTGRHTARVRNDEPRPTDSPSAGIGSVDICLKMLRALMQADQPLSLKQIASETDTAPSKAHRYLQSLIAGGFATQARKSGKYDLGIEALRLGYAALDRIDVVNRTADALEDLAQDIGFHLYLSVWTDEGPLTVRWQRSPVAIGPQTGIGTRRPLWTTAAGRIFLAFLPRNVTAKVLERELALLASPPGEPEIARCIQQVRRAGYAVAHGTLDIKLTGISVPIVDVQNEACAAVTVIKPLSRGDDEDRPIIQKLLDFAAKFSASESHRPSP